MVQVRQAQVERQHNGLARLTDMLYGQEWTPWLPIYAWVIEHDEGLILVDTGETARVHQHGYHPSWHPFYQRAVHFSVHPDEEIGPQLRALGISPRDVRQVVLTHLHTDHAGGLAHLTGSRFWVSEGEWQAASGFGGKVQGYLPHRWPRWWQPEFPHFEDRPIGPFPRSAAVTRRGDVQIVSTPGHTLGHISVIVDGDPALFLAGDTSYTQELLLARRLDGVSPNAQLAWQTMDRILSLARQRPLVYLPSHDSDAENRLRFMSTLAD
jgi:glyoxylase-like metal-dependent hydrolase (beta-lactamase superfamily II)